MSFPARVSALVRNLLRSGHVEQQLDGDPSGPPSRRRNITPMG